MPVREHAFSLQPSAFSLQLSALGLVNGELELPDYRQKLLQVTRSRLQENYNLLALETCNC